MKNLIFEVKYTFRQPIVILTFLVYFLLSFLIINAAGGLFESVRILIDGQGSKVFLNSPKIVAFLVSIFSVLGLSITAILFGNSIYRDIKYQNDQVMFSTGVKKSNYLFPRFLAPLVVNTFIFLAIPLGITIASYMPYLDANYFGPFIVQAYITPLLQIALPNILFTGAIFFIITALKKNIKINWILIILFYAIYAGGMALSNDIDNQYLNALLDPFGAKALALGDVGSSVNEKNTETASFTGVLMANRFLWGGLGILIFIIGYLRFKLTLNTNQKKKSHKVKNTESNINEFLLFKQIKMPKVNQNFGRSAEWYNLGYLFKYEFNKLIRSNYFKIIALLLLIVTLITIPQTGKIYDSTSYILTSKVVQVLRITRLLFIVFIILFTGELIWNSRKYSTHHYEDATPLLNAHFVVPKIFAIATATFILLMIQWLFIYLYQMYAGVSHEFDVMGIYILNNYLYYLVFIALAFIVNALIGNQYIAILVLGIWYFIKDYLVSYLKHNLLIFNRTPGYSYSEMDGFGNSLLGEYAFRSYWMLFATILLYFTTFLIVRGSETGFKVRINELKSIKVTSHFKRIGLVLLLFLFAGGYIFYNTNVLNKFSFETETIQKQISYEKAYSRFEIMPAPSIVDLDTECHIYPHKGKIEYKGFYYLKNNTEEPIDTVILNYNEKIEITNESQILTLIEKDVNFNKLHLYKFKQTLSPSDSVRVNFSYFNQRKGFSNTINSEMPVENGTIFYSPHPQIGYDADSELSDNVLRKKYSLKEKLPLPARTDENEKFKSSLGDVVRYHSVVSTSKDQRAFTSGTLIKEWKREGRNYYEYQADNVISVLGYNSGIYETKEVTAIDTSASPIDLAINYHKPHQYNIELMMEAMKYSIEYYAEHFGPYQFDLLRIIETYSPNASAISLATTIPFSEGLGFTANIEECYHENEIVSIPYPVWSTAHEVAHQWWGHQITPAVVQGATMLTESLAQYSSLKVLEKMYSKEMVGEFLKNEQQRYLISRTGGNFNEPPLATVANETYIYYNKGSIIFYALSEYIGTKEFNAFLSGYLKRYQYSAKPSPTTIEFINELRNSVPDNFKYIVTEWLEKVTLYDFDMGNATYKRNEDLEYNVKFDITATKFQKDEATQIEEEVSMNEYFPIEIKDSKGKIIFSELVQLKNGEQTISLLLNRKPHTISIDPLNIIVHKKSTALNNFTTDVLRAS